jgi:hypothetical protein
MRRLVPIVLLVLAACSGNGAGVTLGSSPTHSPVGWKAYCEANPDAAKYVHQCEQYGFDQVAQSPAPSPRPKKHRKQHCSARDFGVCVPPKFTDPTDQSNYENAFVICETESKAKLKSDLHARSEQFVDLAEAFSHQFVLAARQAPFEGCFDGLVKQYR